MNKKLVAITALLAVCTALIAEVYYDPILGKLRTRDTGLGTGNVVGPETGSVDAQVARYDGATGLLLQASLLYVDDSGSLDIPAGQAYKIGGTALAYGDVGAAAAYHTQAESSLTFSDISTGDVSAAKHGFAPKAPSVTNNLYYGLQNGAWAQVPAYSHTHVESDLTLGDTIVGNVSNTAHGWAPKLPSVIDGKGYGIVNGSWTELTGGGGEPALGNPASDGYVLSSTAAGVRSWVAQSGGSAGSRALDAYTALVLHFDGTTTSFADSSPNAYTITAGASAAQQGTTKKFGAGAMLTSASDYITVGSCSGAINWTQYGTASVGFWFRTTDNTATQFFFADSGGTSNDFYFQSNSIRLRATETVQWTWEPANSTWYYLALVKGPAGYDDVSLYIDGVLQTRASGTLAHGLTLSGGSLVVGNRSDHDYGVVGYVDELAWYANGPYFLTAAQEHANLTATAHGGILPPPASPEQGDVMYYSGSAWVVLHHGTDGQYLKTQGHAANPAWATVTSSGSSRWTEISAAHYTATPASTSTLTFGTDDTATLLVGLPVRYTISSTVYYGKVSAIAANLLTVRGAPLGGDVTKLEYGAPEMLRQIHVSVPGAFEDADNTTLLATDAYTQVRWQGKQAVCIGFDAVVQTADTGTAPNVNVTWGGNSISTSNTNAGIATNGTWAKTGIDISTTNYVVDNEEALEIAVDKIGNGNALDLSVDIIMVMP